MEASSYLGHGECGQGTKSAQQDACCRHDRSASDARTSAVPLSGRKDAFVQWKSRRSDFPSVRFQRTCQSPIFLPKKGHEMGTRCKGPRNGHQLALLFAESFASFHQGWWICTLHDHLEESGPGVSSQHRHHQPWCDARAQPDRVAASRVTNVPDTDSCAQPRCACRVVSCRPGKRVTGTSPATTPRLAKSAPSSAGR